MATPRPIDNSKANPVQFREKEKKAVTIQQITPSTDPTPQNENLETIDKVEESLPNKRQELVLTIPQEQRDEDERTEINSRATSVANLDTLATSVTDLTTVADGESNAISSSSMVENDADLKANENNIDSPYGSKTITEDTKEQNDNLDTNDATQEPPNDAVAEETGADTQNPAKGESANENQEDEQTDDHVVEDDFDTKTVPDADAEIQAVFQAQNVDAHCKPHKTLNDKPHETDVDYEVARQNAKAMESNQADATVMNGGRILSVSDLNGPALRGKTCTPASQYTEISELKFIGDDRSSHGREAKEAMFNEAISLMDARCVSRDSSRMMAQIDHRYSYQPLGGLGAGSIQGPPKPPMSTSSYARSMPVDPSVIALRDNMETPLVGMKHHPYGVQKPGYFLVHQRKPTPMEPLPAWKGYYGNVYFAPISVKQANPSEPPPNHSPNIDQCSEKLQGILLRDRRLGGGPRSHSVASSKRTTDTSFTSFSTVSNPRSSATSQKSAMKRSQSVASVKSRSSAGYSHGSQISRQMSLLDKRSVLSNFNENIEEDINWIQKMESTGSLILKDNMVEPIEKPRAMVHFEKDKIRKGNAMARTLSANETTPDRPPKRSYPSLGVDGGQCDRPTEHSQAFIRARTHHPFTKYNRLPYKSTPNSGSFSPQTFNSFDTGTANNVPAFEQLKATLRRMEQGAGKDELIRMTPRSSNKSRVNDAKRTPYVKFGPEYKTPHPPSSRNIMVK